MAKSIASLLIVYTYDWTIHDWHMKRLQQPATNPQSISSMTNGYRVSVAGVFCLDLELLQ
jgi:hypothetical protein